MTNQARASRGDRSAHAAGADTSGGPHWWRTTWPLGRREWKRLVFAFVAVVAVFSLAGLVLTRFLEPNAITEYDADLARSFADSRTGTGNDMAHWGAFLSNTATKIVVTVLLVAGALARWRRWHEALLIALSLVFEAGAFVTISRLVGRSRPAVPRLLDSPLDTSFPSGHVAAATVYLALAVVVVWHTRSTLARLSAVVVALVVAFVVAVSRMYQGMHYLSDVVAGALLGLVTLAITTRIIAASTRAPYDAARKPVGRSTNVIRR